MTHFFSRAEIAQDLERLGVCAGDALMVHSSLRAIGPLVNGPKTLLNGIFEAIGPEGTLMVYTDWNAPMCTATSHANRIPHEFRSEISPFDPATSTASIYHGAFVEWVRSQPNALRSQNPGASCAAIGARAEFLTQDHPLEFGYGADSPFGKFTQIGGKILMLGAPYDTVSMLHHAEQLADIPNKRLRITDTPLLRNGETVWREIEEFETGIPVSPALDDDYFETVIADFIATGDAKLGDVGNANSLSLPAHKLVPFAVSWIEREAG